MDGGVEQGDTVCRRKSRGADKRRVAHPRLSKMFRLARGCRCFPQPSPQLCRTSPHITSLFANLCSSLLDRRWSLIHLDYDAAGLSRFNQRQRLTDRLLEGEQTAGSSPGA
ncbi:hypothetical protein AAFF_G00245000 [Aldrovandia affinis]|uniref:Uncharacterized protein n=1 Tax=Aldrovandia affinis TaxID=143900 RepID=A0AAD7RDK6_9TELE|nr:hypothetical protein AAFF_G00245000 [Aldrovandia affinis]